jgi:succinoglycan biosynthesis protein ExoU
MNSRQAALMITAKNAACSVGRATTSGRAQISMTEIIVSGDGSKDNTYSEVAPLGAGSGGLKSIENGHSSGPPHDYDLAVEDSISLVLAVLDADGFSRSRADRENASDCWRR